MAISMGFSFGDGENKKECMIPKGDEVAETGSDPGVEFNVEFKPIEHPVEPTEEDHPVKCPMPNSSVLNDGEKRMEQNPESLRKRAEFIVANEGMVVDAQPPAHAVRKRRQTLTRDHSRLPLYRAPPNSILQMHRQCNEFGPSYKIRSQHPC